jgi:hypothetical protein
LKSLLRVRIETKKTLLFFKEENGECKATVTEEDVLDFYDRKFYKVSKKMANDVYDYVDELNLKPKKKSLRQL